MNPEGTDLAPIFILGMSQRTGTNFLRDLLCLHADLCPGVISEDFVASHADLLAQYATEVTRHWNPKAWGIDAEAEKDRMYRYLGQGLIKFLHSQCETARSPQGAGPATSTSARPDKRLVTKTPSVRSLRYFPKLFPGTQLLILIRDGRAVVESAVQSFNRDYETEMRGWVNAARAIEQFQHNATSRQLHYLLVRYEDLWAHREPELRKILSFLNLEPERYDFSAAANLPIRGSSKLAVQGKAVHWNAMEATADFNPLQRWNYWNRRRHERFNWIAGDYLKAFGYEEKVYAGNRSLWRAWNVLMDMAYIGRQFASHCLLHPRSLAHNLMAICLDQMKPRDQRRVVIL